jgi:hypothetical protein
MEPIISKIIGFLVAVCTAAVAALTVGYIARYEFWSLPPRHSDVSPDRRRHHRPNRRPAICDRVFRKAAKIQMTQIPVAVGLIAATRRLASARVRGHIRSMTHQRFYCPARGCYATYDVIFRSYKPAQPPKCESCGWEFPEKHEAHWLHYQVAGSSNRSE